MIRKLTSISAFLCMSGAAFGQSIPAKCHQYYELFRATETYEAAGEVAEKMDNEGCWPALQAGLATLEPEASQLPVIACSDETVQKTVFEIMTDHFRDSWTTYGGVDAWYVQRQYPYPETYEELAQVEGDERVGTIMAHVKALVSSMELGAVVTTATSEQFAKIECGATLTTRDTSGKQNDARIAYSAQSTEDGDVYVEVSW